MEIEYKYKERYNPSSNRLENFDYSLNWWYFITICTKDREEVFWEIIDGEMILNFIWIELKKEIENIPIFRKNVILDEYIIMPNHIHFVIFLEYSECKDVPMEHLNNTKHLNNKLWDDKEMFHRNICTNNQDTNNQDTNLENFSKKYYSNISPKKWTLWNIIKMFKSFFSKNINKIQNEIFFAWHSNYYDRIIRNDDELDRIRKYILENPLKWDLEKNNKENIFM